MLFVLCVFRGKSTPKTHTKHFLTKSGNTFRSQKLGAKHTLAHLAKWASRDGTTRIIALGCPPPRRARRGARTGMSSVVSEPLDLVRLSLDERIVVSRPIPADIPPRPG